MNKVIDELKKISDPAYQKYNKNLIKGNSPILGVKIPQVRKVFQEIKRNGKTKEFFLEYEGKYFEEKLIKGFFIADDSELFDKEVFNYLKEVDSWCLCDTFCNSCKFIKKDLDKYFELVKKLLESDQEFTIRAGYVFLLYYYIDEKYIDYIFLSVLKTSDYYYVNTAICWLISTLYLDYKDKVLNLLSKDINDFVKERTIEKIMDSTRVSEMDKMRVRKLK